MIEFSDTEQEVRQLDRFLSKTENLPSSPELEALRARALGHAERLSNAVAIGFAGEFGAGKSSLANMLAGADVLPTGPQHLELPLVIVAYSEEPQTTVGWWDKPEKTYAGIALEKAAADKPDFISVGLNSPALREVSLFDLPGSGALEESYDKALGLLNFVDCVIWCTNGANAWRESERHLWSQVPAKLRENSVLAVTHADLPPVREALDRVVSRLEKEKDGLFQSVVPIGTPEAVKAMSAEPEPNLELWKDCGGQRLAEEVLRIASVRRSKDLEDAQKDLENLFLPALAALDNTPDVTPVADSAVRISDKENLHQALPNISNPLLEEWLAAVTDIYEEVREATEMKPSAFLQNCQEIVEEFSDRLEDSEGLSPSAEWVPAEFEKAADLLLLLQYENGTDVLRDAVSILAQLGDNLAWAGSTPMDSLARTGT
ncbi:Dynamin family protein [Roseovarius albus]|uniref:Dynamin family protein n=1 Tax=Roseovarius albus TaxID=1247867 RepID=A0A1X6YML1_9RHOB|nr:dynamin family protein [Roseovarius albus]SLN25385.1 Dynamin family protein [Roseovarius albus]